MSKKKTQEYIVVDYEVGVHWFVDAESPEAAVQDYIDECLTTNTYEEKASLRLQVIPVKYAVDFDIEVDPTTKFSLKRMKGE